MPTLRCIIFSLLLFTSSSALACQQCLSKSPLERTIDQASLIALVINKDKNSSASLDTGPEIVNLTVLKIYKGDSYYEVIPVHSWYGQCVYGVHMALQEKAVVMLQEMVDITTGEWDGSYKVVEEGCSEGQLDVRGQLVRVRNTWMPLETFESKYISGGWR